MRSNFQILNTNAFLDKTGIVLSWLCAIHCLAVPFILAFLPMLGLHFLAHEGLEWIFVALSGSVAAASLLPGFFKLHRNINTLLLFAAGIALITSADALFEDSLVGKLFFVSTGAVFVTTAHLLNRHLCSSCSKCRETGIHSSA
jgi:hypothetical protein